MADGRLELVKGHHMAILGVRDYEELGGKECLGVLKGVAFVLEAGMFFPSHVEVGGGPGEEGLEVTEVGVPFDGMCCLDDGVSDGVKVR